MTNAHRDLATPEYWNRSLERSRRRRALLPKARREHNRKKHLSAALATAVVAGPGAPIAAAQVSGDVSTAVAAESPANRAIEIREGGLPLRIGSQGDLVAHVQTKLGVASDGIFGPQTDAAVRKYQLSSGLDVDGIVGPNTWSSLFAVAGASGASLGGSNVPPQVQQEVEQRLEQTGAELAVQGNTGAGTTVGGQVNATPPSATTPTSQPNAAPPTTTPVAGSCSSATISAPVKGTVTSPYGPAEDVTTTAWTSPRPPARRCMRPPAGRSAWPGSRAATATSCASPTRASSRRVTAPVALRRVEWRAGAAGSGDRLCRLHRKLHRTARAFRDSRERTGAEPGHLPGWRLDPGQAGDRRRGEHDQRHEGQHDRHGGGAAGLRRERADHDDRGYDDRWYDDRENDDARDHPGPRGARAERDSRGRGARRGAGRAGRSRDAGRRAGRGARPSRSQSRRRSRPACRPSRSRSRRRSRRRPRSRPSRSQSRRRWRAPAEVRPSRSPPRLRLPRRPTPRSRLPRTPPWIRHRWTRALPPPCSSAVRAKWPLARWVGGAKGEPWRPRSGRAGSSRSAPERGFAARATRTCRSGRRGRSSCRSTPRSGSAHAGNRG